MSSLENWGTDLSNFNENYNFKQCVLIANIPIIEGGDATYHFKTLVPAVAAGAIIGKGGETIAAIQKDTGARVKMSKSHDFYPGKLKFCF